MNIQKAGYTHKTTTYDLSYIKALYEQGRVDTELECQRGYVWDENRQQGLFDSLLRGHRIPEFHSIRNKSKYEIIDGKQRLTTLMRILNDDIPLKRSYAKEDVKSLMAELRKTQLKFSELPDETQEFILNTTVEIAEYSDVSDEEISILFQKLNAGKALNQVGISLLTNLLIRKYFTSYLVDKHPYLEQIFTDAQKGDATDEATLIRLMHLLEVEDLSLVKNLDAGELGEVIKDRNREDLVPCRMQVEAILNEFSKYVDADVFRRISASFMPILLYHFSTLRDRDKVDYGKFVEYFYARRTECRDNRNLTPQVVRRRIEFVEMLFNDFKHLTKI